MERRPEHLSQALISNPSSEEMQSKSEIEVIENVDGPQQSRAGSALFIINILTFVTLEAGFLGLAGTCHSDQFGQNTLRSLSGGINSTASSIFSSEWHVQAVRSGSVIPRETDKVSILTAGFSEKLAYFFSKSSTTFRTIFIVSIFTLEMTTIQVVNLTMGHAKAAQDFAPFYFLIDCAEEISRGEQTENTTFQI
ncbi:hypothetical protein M422DRAFT_246994 [Sphaerobolus stellatus SS14]|nr:hypothetical protein M422DRAFT_246994 [Sphaerobolus stellatus SS14]